MSLPIVWWPVIPETLEARLAQAEADARFAEQWELANFEAWAESMADALWGIWEIPINEGHNTIKDIKGVEEREREDPDLILSQLEWWSDIENWIEVSSDAISDLIETPFIERLIDDWLFTREAWDTILQALNEGGNFDDTISSLEDDSPNPEQKQAIIAMCWVMNSEEWKEQFSQDFERDFWNQFTERVDGVFQSERKQEAFDMVASNYMIGESENPEERKKALDMTFWTAVNTAISWKIFERNEYFETRLSAVRNPDIIDPTTRLQALTDILNHVDRDQWGKWSTVRLANARNRVIQTIAQAWLTERFLVAQEALNLAQQENDQARVAELQAEIEKIAQETWVEAWDLIQLAGWELDTLSNIS